MLLAYSARNRSASCRIPFTNNPKAKRVEVRFPDPLANPYRLCRDADGRPRRHQNKMDHGPAMDKDLYDLPPKGSRRSDVCGSCAKHSSASTRPRILKAGGVFDDDFIDAYIELKMTEDQVRTRRTRSNT